MRLEKWIGPAFIVAGLATLAAVLLRQHSARSGVEFGLLYGISRYDQTLPLLGLGIAVAQAPPRLFAAALLIFAAAVPAGSLFAAWLAATMSNPLFPLGHVLALGPTASVATGLVLVAPSAARMWMLPLAAVCCGAALGLVVDITDATREEWLFALGAVLAGGWILITPIFLWRGFARNWFPIAAHIFGGWLIAIGTMLAALVLIRMRDQTGRRKRAKTYPLRNSPLPWGRTAGECDGGSRSGIGDAIPVPTSFSEAER